MPRRKQGVVAQPLKTAPRDKYPLTPLDYMLRVICDEKAPQVRRDRMAIAAAPYCHPRLSERQQVGKKDQQEQAAQTAGAGTEWASDLEFGTPAN